ncbi:hypothetical protein [Granulicatella adiacens]|uniref:hypothetical protein n=1 Tax=Granulicatella adiacens TaxID=46124 RepID=UPI0021A95B65|nr:hypothetical protein [Granulicatella adiacens]MCT2160035.1 hypothetical protein [Granulicatella adiacens]
MNLYLTPIVISALSLLMSIIALKQVNKNEDSNVYYYSKNKMEIEEIKKRLKKQELKLSYDQAISDILAELPVGSAKVTKEDIDNTVVIRVKRDVFDND